MRRFHDDPAIELISLHSTNSKVYTKTFGRGRFLLRAVIPMGFVLVPFFVWASGQKKINILIRACPRLFCFWDAGGTVMVRKGEKYIADIS